MHIVAAVLIGVALGSSPPVRILIVGNSGVGKSTLFNSLIGEEIQATGAGLPVTKAPKEYELSFEDAKLGVIRTFLEESGKPEMANLLHESAAVTLIDTEGFGAAPIDGKERSVEDFRRWQEADETRIVSDLESVAPVSIIIFAVPTMTRTPAGFRPVTRLQMETVHLMELVQRTLEPRPASYLVNQIFTRFSSLSFVPRSLLEVLEILQQGDPYSNAELLIEKIPAAMDDMNTDPEWLELLDALSFVLSQSRPNIWDRVVFTLTMVNERVNYMPARLKGRPEDWIFDFVAGQRNAIYETLGRVLGRPVDTMESPPPVIPIGNLKSIKFAHSERLFSNPQGDWRQDLLIACLSRLPYEEQYAFYVVHTDALRQHNERLQGQRRAMREVEACIKLNNELAVSLSLEQARLEMDMQRIAESIEATRSEIRTEAAKHETHMSQMRVKGEDMESLRFAVSKSSTDRLIRLEEARSQLSAQIRQAEIQAEQLRLEAREAEARANSGSSCTIL